MNLSTTPLAPSFTFTASPSLLSNDFLPFSVYEPSADDFMEWNFDGSSDAEAESSSDFERDRDQLPYSPYDPADEGEDEYPEDDEDGYTDAEADSQTLRDAGMGMDEDYGLTGGYGTSSYADWN